MNSAEYDSVVNKMVLPDGLPWSIPVTLSISKEQDKNIQVGDTVIFTDEEDSIVGYINVSEKYRFNKNIEAKKIYLTDDLKHPGVSALYGMGDTLIAGEITYFKDSITKIFPDYNRTPAEVRKQFQKNGWKTIVAFQTRNPVHRAHEYIQKCAMEMVDGLLLHPIVGETKDDDIPANVRMECYEVLLDNYYPKDRVLLSVLMANMRYAGPKEAIFHSIMRKNFGCTHFIIGRDHAGVGNYYGTYDAQKIFDKVDMDKLAIKPLFFDHSFYCKACEQMVSIKTCPHSKENHVFLSGTKVRELLKEGICPPNEFTRPEVAKVLLDSVTNE
jgi:sulfate adenylyltransferase